VGGVPRIARAAATTCSGLIRARSGSRSGSPGAGRGCSPTSCRTTVCSSGGVPPADRVAGQEHRHDPAADRGRQVRGAGVVRDDDRGVAQQHGVLAERRPPGQVDRRRAASLATTAAVLPASLGTPADHHREPRPAASPSATAAKRLDRPAPARAVARCGSRRTPRRCVDRVAGRTCHSSAREAPGGRPRCSSSRRCRSASCSACG
jgi:hypothetical protein